MEYLREFLSHIAVATAIASLLATFSSFIAGRQAAKAKLRAAAVLRLQQVLESADLREIGRYLDEVVGNFNVHEYITNPQVARTIDAYLWRLEAFVGTDAGIAKQVAEAPGPSKSVRLLPLPEELQKALDTLRFGEPWNALARVRRYIEMTLRQLTEALDVDPGPISSVSSNRPFSAGQLVSLLSRKGLISPDAAESLRYAISICNKAIHGLDVSFQEAEDALFHAAEGLNALQSREHKAVHNPSDAADT